MLCASIACAVSIPSLLTLVTLGQCWTSTILMCVLVASSTLNQKYEIDDFSQAGLVTLRPAKPKDNDYLYVSLTTIVLTHLVHVTVEGL